MSDKEKDVSEKKIVEVKRNRFGYYVGADKQYYRRVTTLNAFPKPALTNWAAKEVATYAVEEAAWLELPTKREKIDLLKGAPWRKRDDAADHGTAVHQTIEALVKGEPLPDTLQHEEEVACAILVEEMLKQLGGETLGSEVTVIGQLPQGPGYAGTFDLWSRFPDMDRWLLDFKTGKGYYPDFAAQLAAYQNAKWALLPVPGSYDKDGGTEHWEAEAIRWGPDRVDRLGIVHVRPEFARLIPVRPEMHERAWTAFRAAATVKIFQLDTDDYRSRPKEPVFEDVMLEVGSETKVAQTA